MTFWEAVRARAWVASSVERGTSGEGMPLFCGGPRDDRPLVEVPLPSHSDRPRNLAHGLAAALSVDARFDWASDGAHLCSAILVALLYGLRGADRRMESDVVSAGDDK